MADLRAAQSARLAAAGFLGGPALADAQPMRLVSGMP